MRGMLALISLISGAFMEKFEKKEEFNFNLFQSDYELKAHRLVLTRYSKDYVKFMSVVPFKYNRTTMAVNLTLSPNVDLGNELELIEQLYKSASNEYRLFPARLEVGLCKAISVNMFGLGGLMACGNFTGCSLLKGKTYHSCNWITDVSKYPPLIPGGDYMVETQALYRSKEVFVLRGYGTVSRPLTW